MSIIEFKPRLGELRRQVPEDTLAITIEGSYLQVLERRRDHVSWWAMAPLPEGTLRTGHVVGVHQIALCIQQLLRGINIRRSMRTVLTLPTFTADWSLFTLPGNIPNRDLEAAMLKEQRRLSPIVSNDDTLQTQRGVIGGGGKQPWQVYSTGVPKEYLYNFVRGVQAAGLKPQVVDLRAMALFRAAGLPTCVCVDAGRNSVEVGVLQNGIPLWIHSKYLGSDEIDPNNYQNALDDEVQRAQRALLLISEGWDQRVFPPQAPVVLSGEMAVRTDLQQFLEEATGRSVTRPYLGVSLPDGLPVEAVAAGVGASLYP